MANSTAANTDPQHPGKWVPPSPLPVPPVGCGAAGIPHSHAEEERREVNLASLVTVALLLLWRRGRSAL